MNTFRNFLACFFLAISFMAIGQNTMLEVQVSKDSVYFGNQVKVTFIASNISGSFVAPDFEGFKLVNGPFTSSSYSFINGSESRKTTYIYILEPLKLGKLKIGKAAYKGTDKDISSNEINIFVKANPEGIKESADKNEGRTKNDFFEGFGSIDEFFNTPDMNQLRSQPKEAPIKAAKPKYNFKTEKL